MNGENYIKIRRTLIVFLAKRNEKNEEKQGIHKKMVEAVCGENGEKKEKSQKNEKN